VDLLVYTDQKENKIFLIYKEIQMGSGAKSYMRKGFLIYSEEMRKYFTIYEDAVIVIYDYDFAPDPSEFPYTGGKYFLSVYILKEVYRCYG
jgi:hypothetical protein